MRRVFCALLAAVCLLGTAAAVETEETAALDVKAESALLMEKESGTVLYEKNAHEQLEPASVTKVMTLLLVMEAVDRGQLGMEEMVTVSAAAAGMGGSQTYMKENERFTVDDMLKCVCVVSANDASVALAEHLAGSEEAFVARMNRRAEELGMNDTVFRNCTGLPAEGHVTSAYDIAVMSRELILNHPGIQKYTTIWMDSIRDGAFALANTNKLIRYYDGATGLKTGSTSTAKCCISATAERDGMELIAVVMKAPTSGERFTAAKTLLNYGFSAYAMEEAGPGEALPPVKVLLGKSQWVQPMAADSGRVLIRREDREKLQVETNLADTVEAPVEQGQKLGELIVLVDGVEAGRIPLLASDEVPRLSAGEIWLKLLRGMLWAA